MHVEHLVHNVLVKVVKAALVAHGGVKVLDVGIAFPVGVPVLGHRHADEHHPAQRGDGIIGKLTRAIGQVGLGNGGPLSLHVGAFRQSLIGNAALHQVAVQVLVQCRYKLFHFVYNY